MDSVNLSAAATALALSICRAYPKDQLLLIGSLISQIGETVTRVSLQADLLDAINNPKSSENSSSADLAEAILSND